MTTLEIVETFERYAATHGYTGISGEATRDRFLDERLASFCRKTKCLYTDAAVLTLTIGTALYDLRGSVLTKKVFLPSSVTVDGSPLTDATALRYGLWSQAELQAAHRTYLTDPNGKPRLAAFMPPGTLRLYPTPDSAYTTHVAGWYLHAGVNWQSDASTLEIPEEFHRTFAAFAAASAVVETSATASDYERIAMVDASEAENYRLLLEQCANASMGSGVRGLVNRGRRVHRL